MAAHEREAPDQAGKRLQAQLDALMPCLQVPRSAPRSFCERRDAWGFTDVERTVLLLRQPAPHPRGYPVTRDELEELCVDDSERSRLKKVPPASVPPACACTDVCLPAA